MGVHTWGGCVHAWDVHWVLGDIPPPCAPPAPSLSSGCFEGMMGEKELVLSPQPMPATSAPTSASGRAACPSRKGVWGWCLLLPCHQTPDMDAGSRTEQPQVAAYRVEHSPTDMVIPSGCPVPQGTGLHSPHVQNPSRSPSACSYTQCTPTHTPHSPQLALHRHTSCARSPCAHSPPGTLSLGKEPPLACSHMPLYVLSLCTHSPLCVLMHPLYNLPTHTCSLCSHPYPLHTLPVHTHTSRAHSHTLYTHIHLLHTHPVHTHTSLIHSLCAYVHTCCACSYIPHTFPLCKHPTHACSYIPCAFPLCTYTHNLCAHFLHARTPLVHAYAFPVHSLPGAHSCNPYTCCPLCMLTSTHM